MTRLMLQELYYCTLLWHTTGQTPQHLIQAGETFHFKWRPQLQDPLKNIIKNRLKGKENSLAEMYYTIFNITERYYCRFYNLKTYFIA